MAFPMIDNLTTTSATENWKPVVGLEGRYEVSDLGRVRSITTPVTRRCGRGPNPDATYQLLYPSVIRATYINPDGYLTLKLAERGTVHVHCLVLEAFVGPCPEGQEGCHGDGNPSNNALSNLRWGTPKDNADDRRRHGRNCTGEKQGRSKLKWPDVRAIRALTGMLSDCELARRYAVTSQNIRRIRLHQTWRDDQAASK